MPSEDNHEQAGEYHPELADTAYVSGEQLAQSQTTYGVALIGPVRPDVSWQARAPDGYATPRFQIDWDAQCQQR